MCSLTLLNKVQQNNKQIWENLLEKNCSTYTYFAYILLIVDTDQRLHYAHGVLDGGNVGNCIKQVPRYL